MEDRIAERIAIVKELQAKASSVKNDDSLSAIPLPDYIVPMFILSMNTGARRGELFNLIGEYVDFKKQTIGLLGKNRERQAVMYH